MHQTLVSKDCSPHNRSLFTRVRRRMILGNSERLKGIIGLKVRLLPRSLAFLVEQPDLHHLLAIFHSLLFGKIEVPEHVEHTFVPAL